MIRTALQLNNGQPVDLEAAPGDDPGILGFEAAHPRERWCYEAGNGAHRGRCAQTWRPGPGLIVTTNSGQVVASARISICDEGAVHGHLTVSLTSRFENTNLSSLLLKQVIEEARAASLEHLYAFFPHRAHDAIRDCREAGFRVESVVSEGSISEVALQIDRSLS